MSWHWSTTLVEVNCEPRSVHVMQLLADDYTVVAPDLRGFGYTSKPAAGYDAATIAGDLAALTTHLGLEDVTVIGHDWGAVFGYVYAASSRGQVSALGIVEMALPGVGIMEQAMAPVPGGNFLWHMGFQSVPDLPELLIAGKERPYLQWFFEHFACDPSTIGAAELDEYVAAITQVGALRAGLAVYQDFFASAEQVGAHAKTPLTIPVRAFGGEACLSGLTLMSVQAVAPKAEGGVIDRCGHWAAEERSDFVADLVRELANAGR
jgi:pimeloyl-ACP methyl ester carboxylesterase